MASVKVGVEILKHQIIVGDINIVMHVVMNYYSMIKKQLTQYLHCLDLITFVKTAKSVQ